MFILAFVAIALSACIQVDDPDNPEDSGESVTIPTISSFYPLSGSVGTTVSVNGTNFSTTAVNNTVLFNGVAATVTAATTTQLTVTVPSGATTGAISVTVGATTVTSSASFTVITQATEPPTVSAFAPGSGSVGTTVTITGTNFSVNPILNTVLFNGTKATVTSATATQLTVIVPSGATTGSITVIVGENSVVSSDSFTVDVSSTNVVVTYNGTTATVANPYEGNGVTATVSSGDVVVRSTISDGEVNYILAGTASNGSFKIYSDYKFRLTLKGVNITNDDGPAINIQSSKRASVYLEANTTSTLIDGTNYASSTEDQKAALFSEGQMEFAGPGSLIVTGNYGHAICSDDYISISEGAIKVIKAAKDGIHANDYFLMNGGTLNVISNAEGVDCEEGYININAGVIDITTSGDKGNAIASEGATTINSTSPIALKVSGKASKGIKTGGDLNIENCDMTITTSGAAFYDSENYDIAVAAGINCGGNMTFSAGTMTINCSGKAGKGIKTDGALNMNGGALNVTTTGSVYTYGGSESEAKAIKCDGAYVQNSGTVTISSADDGIKSETSIAINGGSLTISKSVEGVEAPNITFNNGNGTITASDDAVNATKGNGGESNDGSLFTMAGGTLSLSSTSGDALDSNGSVAMTGGILVAQGPNSAPEVAMDYNGSFNISGGLLMASGPSSGNMIQATSSTSSQYTVLIKLSSRLAAGTLVNVQNSSGATLVTYAPIRNAYYLVFSSSELASGKSYKVYTGGTYTGGSVTNGLYSSGTYSGGSQKGTFTISGKVTTVSL